MALDLLDSTDPLASSPAFSALAWLVDAWAARTNAKGMEYDEDRGTYMGSVARLDYEEPRGLEIETEDGHVYRLQFVGLFLGRLERE